MTGNEAPEDFEFRLSPDRRRIAIWDPGNSPWFVPVENMQGRFVSSNEMNQMRWTRYTPEYSGRTVTIQVDARLATAIDILGKGLDTSPSEIVTKAVIERAQDAANAMRGIRMPDRTEPVPPHLEKIEKWLQSPVGGKVFPEQTRLLRWHPHHCSSLEWAWLPTPGSRRTGDFARCESCALMFDRKGLTREFGGCPTPGHLFCSCCLPTATHICRR